MAERRLFLRAHAGAAPFAMRRLLLLIAVAFATVPMLPSASNRADAALYTFTSHTFTPCGVTGRLGPTGANCTSAYTTTWDDNASNFTVVGGIQRWTVPVTGLYEFTAAGARGGGTGAGSGRIVRGRVTLTEGDVIKILVGQEGTVSSGDSTTGGGGGGSFVSTSANVAMFVGGGGGGAGQSAGGTAGSTTECGLVGVNAGSGAGAAGGCSGNGGGATTFGGGGAGFSGNGTTKTYSNEAAVPVAFTGGGTGGGGGLNTALGGGHGGFGGGGGACSCSTGGGGGGGGYSGGGGGGPSGWGAYGGGGGGGSFVMASATSVNTNAGTRAGAGYVTVEIVAPVVTTMTASVSSPTNVSALSYAINFSESVTGFDSSDVTLSGTSGGWSIGSLSGSGAGPYTLSLSSSSVTSGSLTVTIATNSALGATSGMLGPPAPYATTMNVDVDPPTASVATSPSSPAAGMSLTFGLAFGESVSGIAAADFTNAGNAQGCVFTPSAVSGSSVNVVVTQCQEGSLQLRLAANGVTDAAGNTGPTSDVTSPSITLAASALTVTAATQNVNYGGSWTDSYSQSGLLGGDSLTVTYTYSGATTLGTPYGPSATKPTAGGTYSIIPSVGYGAGNTNRYTLTKNNGTLTIARIAQSALTVSSTSATYGQNLALTTSGGSGTGAVTWTKISGACTLAGSVIIPDDAGSSCVVKATKAADDNYTAIDSSNTSITTGMANQAALTVSSTSASYGQSLALATSGGSGTGAVTWTKISGTCTLTGSSIMPGDVGSSCVVKATKAADNNYNAVHSANTSITTVRGSQSGFSVTNATSFTTGSSLALTASGGQSGGLVSWSLTSGQCTLQGSTLTATRGGISCVVEATRAGDSNYLSTSDSATITVNKIAQVLTFRSTAPSPANPGGTYTVSVDSDAFLAPVLAIANSSSSVCSISAGVVTFNTVGTCLISASQAGNDTYSSAAASQSVTVTALAAAAPQTTAPAVALPVATTPSVAVPQALAPSVTTTTTPPKASSGPTTTLPRPVVTSTTSTTTTVPVRQDAGSPNAGADGEYPELKAGEMSVLVRGKQVKVKSDTTGGRLTLTLPNKVVLRIGSTDATAKTARLNADGVLVVNRGETIEVSAEGFIPGTTYTVFMFSDPVELGRGVVMADGTVAGTLDVPTDVKTGGHTLQMNGVGAGDEVVSVSVGFEVLERSDNTLAAVLAISTAMLLALLGGRPVWRRRRRPA